MPEQFGQSSGSNRFRKRIESNNYLNLFKQSKDTFSKIKLRWVMTNNMFSHVTNALATEILVQNDMTSSKHIHYIEQMQCCQKKNLCRNKEHFFT